MGGRIRLYLAAVVFLAAMTSADQAAASPESPAQFVDAFGNQAIEALREPGLGDAERVALVRDLLRRGLDLAFIGRFVLGRNWARATAAQQADYLALFEGYVVKTYAAWFARNVGERLTVVEVRQANPKDVVVRTRIERRNQPPIFAEWRVRAIANQDRIIDIASKGISLAGNQRLEFEAVVKRNGIDGLIAFLRGR
jgi:phospholipid transport system substrate-binding protein